MSLILLADDDPAYLTMMTDCLKLEGYEVETARDAGQIGARLSQQPFNAAILDMQMPMGGGVAAAKRIRAHYAHITIPIIVCSGMPVDKTKEWFQGMPKLTVYQKPPDIRTLMTELKRLLSEA
ncbi:MAG: response regulator [Elusimicrobia bacterium]|nr:response regulator [Elusimicrobiota bacterium]